MSEHQTTRCGTIAIVGRPNVGKSTLLNYLVGSKISITSKKAQTTRYQLLGIQTIDDTQFLFIDTPGFQLKHLNLMNKGLNKTVNQVLSNVDVVLFVIESRGMTEEDLAVMKLIPKDRPTILVMNKVDLMKDKNELPIYTVVSIEGEAHSQTFTIECSIKKYDIKTQGVGNSRRMAEQEAALKAYQLMLELI